MKKSICKFLTAVLLLLVTTNTFAAKTDKLKDEFRNSTNGWNYPSDQSQATFTTLEDELRITLNPDKGGWFSMKKDVTVDVNLYPQISIRINDDHLLGSNPRWFIKIEKWTGTENVWKEFLIENSEMPEDMPGYDEAYMESVYVWNIKNFFQEEGIPTNEPVTFNMQFTIERADNGSYLDIDWLRSDYNDNKVEPTTDPSKVMINGSITDNMENANGWSFANGSKIEENGIVGIQTSNGNNETWSIMKKNYAEDFTQFPYFAVNIAQVSHDWHMKITHNDKDVIINKANAYQSGNVYIWNVAELAQLSGKQNFDIQVVADGANDANIKLDWIKSLNYVSPNGLNTETGAINDPMNSVDGWRNIDAGAISLRNGFVCVSAQNGSTQGWYVIRKDYSENVDEFPYLQVELGEFNENWEVKVVAPNGEKSLSPDEAIKDGNVYTWNLQRITGTNGTNNYGIQLLGIGNSGNTYFSTKNIKSLKYKSGTSGIENTTPAKTEISAYGTSRLIIIESATASEIQITDLSGRVLKQQHIAAGRTEISMNAGYFIVTGNNIRTKVVVK